MRIDSTDLRILSQLEADAGVRLTKFAKKLRMSRQALDYRIRKLRSLGALRGFYGVVNFSALGFWQYKVYCKLQNPDVDSEDSMSRFLSRVNGVIWGAKCRGRFDFTYSLLAKDPARFSEIQNTVYAKFGANIQDKDILTTETSRIISRPFSKDEPPSEITYGKSCFGKRELDPKDEGIVRAFAEDGMASIAAIAKKAGVSPDSAFYRLRKLRKEGIISEPRADIDIRKLGLTLYKVLIRLNSYQPELFQKIEEYSRTRALCVQYLKLLGRWDVELEYRVKDTEELQGELSSLRLLFSDAIRDYELLEVYDQLRLHFYPFRTHA